MDAELLEMQRKVDDLGRRIKQREQEWRARGEFSDTHAALVSGIKAQHSRLAGRISETPRLHWSGIRDELTRDYNALAEALGRLIERLDRQQTKSEGG